MLLKQTFEKLDTAVQALICNDTLLHDRLDLAIGSLALLTQKDFPPDSRKEFNQLMGKIHIYRDSGDRVDLQSSLARAIFELLKNFLNITSGGGFGFMPM